MRVIHTVAKLRQAVAEYKHQGQSVGLVPTMGNLHAGHISLVHLAKQQADVAITSIFVNPLQFGENEDLDNYPRTLTEDVAQLAAAGCDLVFAPSVAEMYPSGTQPLTTVQVAEITQHLCGRSRPTHFVGVTTVVTKLFNLCQPDLAVFGRKDYQQLAVIRRMTADLCLPITIIGGEITRETDGLAMSSRNHYLTPAERQRAPDLQRQLQMVAELIGAGDRNYPALEAAATQALNHSGFTTDYFNIFTPELTIPTATDKQLVILAATYLGKARILDNIELDID